MSAALRLALTQAERWDLVSRNVAQLVERPRAPRFEPAPLTPAEASLVLATVTGDRLATLYEISIRLGLRQAEACGLRWRDVDLATGVLVVRHQLQLVDKVWQFVPPKTERSRRTIELSAVMCDSLRAHRERQNHERDHAGTRWREWELVFPSSIGTPLYPRTIGRT